MNAVLKQFLIIGNEIAKATVPGVAAAEASIIGIRKGKDRRKNVTELAKNAVVIAEAVSGREDLVNDADFTAAVDQINDGYAAVLKVLQRRADAQPAQ